MKIKEIRVEELNTKEFIKEKVEEISRTVGRDSAITGSKSGDFTASSIQWMSSAFILKPTHFKCSSSSIPNTTANAAVSLGKCPMTLVHLLASLCQGGASSQ